MKPLSHHVKRIQAKPHHVRKRIAFSVAAAGTALVALVWLAGSLASGAFMIQGSSFAESVGAMSGTLVAGSAAGAGSQNLAGAAAALPNGSANTAGITVEDVHTASSTKAAEPTVIPF